MIDPLLQSTYVGAGHVFSTGHTASTNLAATGSAQSANGGVVDVFIARLSAALTAVQKVTYYGGSGFVTMLAPGQCTIVATQAGNGVYAAAIGSLNFALMAAPSIPALSSTALLALSLPLGGASAYSFSISCSMPLTTMVHEQWPARSGSWCT